MQEIKLSHQFSKHLTFNGSSQSVRPMRFNPSATDYRSKLQRLRLQFVHADHVRLSETQPLPRNWMNIGSSKLCDVQGLYEPSRILTFQGHLEFDRFVNYETLKAFAPYTTWTERELNDALAATQVEDDADAVTDFVMEFLLGRDLQPTGPGRLLTPPELESPRRL